MVKAAVRYTGHHFRAVAKAEPIKPYQKILIGAFLLFTAAASGWMLSEALKYFRKDRDDFAFTYVIFFVLVFSTFLRLMKAVTGVASAYSRIKPAEQMRYFEFSNDEMLLTVEGEIEHTERHFRLPGIDRAIDTGEYFVIYMYKNMYCMLAYKDITEGTPEKLRSLLYNAIGDKLRMSGSK